MFLVMFDRFPGVLSSSVARCTIGMCALLFAPITAEFSQLRVSNHTYNFHRAFAYA